MSSKERYYFFLNPYTDSSFTKCPKCDFKTKIKKLPLTILIEKNKIFLNLNKTCKYYPSCDLIITKKNELDSILMQFLGTNKLGKHSYSVIGTQDKTAYLSALNSGNKENKLEGVSLFKDVWNFEIEPQGLVLSKKR